jgi:hypothetical protein
VRPLKQFVGHVSQEEEVEVMVMKQWDNDENEVED